MSFGGALIGDKGKADGHVDERFFALDDKRAEQITIDRRVRVRVVPDTPSGVDSQSPIYFHIRPDSSSAIDLASAYFTMRCRLSVQNTYVDGGADGGGAVAVAATNAICPTVMGPHALFSEIRMRINGQDVSDDVAGGTYPYVAYTKNLLWEQGCPSAASRTSGWLSDLECFVLEDPDTVEGTPNAAVLTGAADTAVSTGAATALIGGNFNAGAVPSADQLAGLNAAFNLSASPAAYHRRSRWNGVALGNAWLTLAFRPKDGTWQQPYYLPPGVGIEIELRRTPRSFAVIGTGTAAGAGTSGQAPDLRIQPNSMELWYDRCYPSEDAMTALMEARLAVPIRINNIHSRISKVSVAVGSSGTIPNLLSGIIPDLVVMFFVPQACMDNRAGPGGANNAVVPTDPFGTTQMLAEAPGAGALRLQVGGDQYPTYGNMETYIQAYQAYCEATKYGADFLSTSGSKPIMSFQQWLRRPCYCFNLRQDQSHLLETKTDDLRRGSITLTWKRSADFAAAQNLVVVGFTHAAFEIDAAGGVKTIAY
eukprot:m.314590 g.314590  ORF g.314590 m.314590 type:complete len:537 (+) comp23063_c0_seq12:1332-2942(+)